eukprot:snap_masked-scaffold_37-processed-gene-2.62-mRNA-1 protein AED:1.00 eAED:1.00 QI:0/-1/0/0/-1/1/1/0/326
MTQRLTTIKNHLSNDKSYILIQTLLNLWLLNYEQASLLITGNPKDLEHLLSSMTLEKAKLISLKLFDKLHSKEHLDSCCFKLGWKNVFDQTHCLYAPLPISCIFTDSTINISDNFVFCAEAEFGFSLNQDLVPQDFTQELTENEAKKLIKEIFLCIEFCGCRINSVFNQLKFEKKSRSLPSYVCDALLGSKILQGKKLFSSESSESLDDILNNMASTKVKFTLNNKILSEGTPKNNPFNSPLSSFTFFVNDFLINGQNTLYKDSFVISGHCCQIGFSRLNGKENTFMPEYVELDGKDQVFNNNIVSGDVLRANFGAVGSVSCELIP